jgi:hypothetical protein
MNHKSLSLMLDDCVNTRLQYRIQCQVTNLIHSYEHQPVKVKTSQEWNDSRKKFLSKLPKK